jgi:hypothetical protein
LDFGADAEKNDKREQELHFRKRCDLMGFFVFVRLKEHQREDGLFKRFAIEFNAIGGGV